MRSLLALFFVGIATASRFPQHDLKPEWTQPKKVGDNVPDITFVTRTRTTPDDFDWKMLSTQDLFAKKRVVVFSLPGAFTPTCSSTHLPGYNDAYEQIIALGIDDVYCTYRYDDEPS